MYTFYLLYTFLFIKLSLLIYPIIFFPIRVNRIYWVIPTRHVWRPWVIFLRQGIHYVPSSRHGVVVAGTVVVPVQSVGAVELFAYVFIT